VVVKGGFTRKKREESVKGALLAPKALVRVSCAGPFTRSTALLPKGNRESGNQKVTGTSRGHDGGAIETAVGTSSRRGGAPLKR